jgi:hypothetical protein
MPLEPPIPGRILDQLRAALGELQRFADAHPDAPQVQGALRDVEAAIRKLDRSATPAA